MPERSFDDYVRKPEAGMRILRYPEQKHSIDEQNGIGAHTDVECFTIVTQNSVGGLEVLSKDGDWIKAEPIPGSFVVNIADCFMRQTNDYFVSTVHRVINKSGKERYSVPFFFGFDRKKVLEPIPTCVSENNPMKYPIMTGGRSPLSNAALLHTLTLSKAISTNGGQTSRNRQILSTSSPCNFSPSTARWSLSVAV
jgi:isopenicillin N synthase-like dioxygenase